MGCDSTAQSRKARCRRTRRVRPGSVPSVSFYASTLTHLNLTATPPSSQRSCSTNPHRTTTLDRRLHRCLRSLRTWTSRPLKDLLSGARSPLPRRVQGQAPRHVPHEVEGGSGVCARQTTTVRTGPAVAQAAVGHVAAPSSAGQHSLTFVQCHRRRRYGGRGIRGGGGW